MFWLFEDRADAGRQLAAKLEAYGGRDDVIVLGLPRGGVPVAYEVAVALGARLDVLVVRKLGLPRQPELAIGAIASGGALYLNENVLRAARVSDAMLQVVEAGERAELVRREKLYRGKRPVPPVRGKTVIVVDDGMATGASMQAAVMALRSLKPERIVVAVPVAPADAARRLADAADEFVCVLTASDFQAVGQFYRDFGQTTDEEVRRLLSEHARKATA
ncbi:MAG TPA: phosphoribosyltransferase family protein [Rhodanobacteraceae bacterium]|jgi:putative phosphoribosyl transferase|nr:phosphoribosyltransferase family protein [Rhodanobacteraceae bacterium]